MNRKSWWKQWAIPIILIVLIGLDILSIAWDLK